MNREVVQAGAGAGIYPLLGDVTSTAGNSTVRVTGLQGVTVNTPGFGGGEVLTYNINTNQWVPLVRACIQVDKITVSTDWIISVDVAPLFLVNGS